jgi:predicted transposase YdaD
MSTPHDTSYKQLFSCPEMMRDLLIGYVPGKWLENADFSTLTQVGASYVSATGKQRHDDMVWRIDFEDFAMLAEQQETWFDYARVEGRQEGLQAGEQKGEAKLLTRQLTRRFGPLSPRVEARLREADSAQLEAWFDASFDAQSLTEVLGLTDGH